MKKMTFMLALLLLLTGTAAVFAVELKADQIRSFDKNILTVTSEDGGRLTIEAFSGTVQLENPVTDLKIKAGTVEIPWAGLSFGGEPIRQGSLTLRATLAGSDRTVEQTEITVKAAAPKPAVVCCLPVAQEFYANGKNMLRIEIALSAAGSCDVMVAPKDSPETAVWHRRVSDDAREPMVISWDGKGQKGKLCPPGEYIISARSKSCPEYVQTASVTLLEQPLPEPELSVTGSLIPEDLSDDAAVWDALTAPVTIGDGPEGKGLYIMDGKTGRAGVAGTVACRTVGVAVLEVCDDGWVKVGAWRQLDGFYTEGYVKADKLRTIRPNIRYGAVVDKDAQTMTIYEYGKKIGTVMVSTGLTTAGLRKADTHSGVFLLGTRMQAFLQDGHMYDYPIRIEGGNLIHQMGYAREDGLRNFEEELATLGKKPATDASGWMHGPRKKTTGLMHGGSGHIWVMTARLLLCRKTDEASSAQYLSGFHVSYIISIQNQFA